MGIAAGLKRTIYTTSRALLPFPGDVEVSLALKMRHTGGEFTFTFGEITASRKEIDKAMAEHEVQKRAKETLQ